MKARALASLVLLLAAAAPARADESFFVHVVRPTETLASIADAYYGDPRRESVLVAENGLTTQGGAAIVVGLRLVIPWASHHRVAPGETWAQIATLHYGDPRRVGALTEANPQISSSVPDEGAEVLVPYPLRHVARQGETLQRIAQLYYDDQGQSGALMRFNSMRRRRLSRGQIVLVPLHDLLLSEDGRQRIASATGDPVTGGEVRALQSEITERIPELARDVRFGRYAEAVALGNRLLGAGEITGNQVVSIQRELAVAYVALDRRDLAIDAFVRAIERQPDLTLDSRLTSPIVLGALEEAQARYTARQAEEAAAVGDAGVAPDAGVE